MNALKVLQINNVYGIGSTGKLTKVLHDAIREDGFESVVLYGRGPEVRGPGIKRICGNFYGKANSLLSKVTGMRYGGCVLSTARTINLIKTEAPDVVHLQCINGNFVNIYWLVRWLKKHKIPTVLTLHAEFMYTANCSHAFECERWKTGCGSCPHLYRATKSIFLDRTHRSFQKMETAFTGFEPWLRVVSVSPWVMERATQSPILREKDHEVILNGLDTDIFYPHVTPKLREQFQNGQKAIIFHASPMFRDRDGDIKGGAYVIELARRLRDRATVIVAGKHELSGPVPENLVLLGEIRDQDLLAQYYTLADCTVLTSKRETFSMVCAESLCCGTPVLGFCAGAPERISLPAYSHFVPQGDMDALEQTVGRFLEEKLPERAKIAREAQKCYDKRHMIEQYEELYRRMKCSKSN